MGHLAGFVNILGNPNVGKSTLMNSLVGEKLSIITSKAQTTRHRILGIVNGDDFQIVYSDTPGIVKPHYKLHQQMMGFVNSALQDADVFLYVVEPGESQPEQSIVDKLNGSGIPIILVINKIDKVNEDALVATEVLWSGVFPSATVVKVSALKGINIDVLIDQLKKDLPESPPYFPKDDLTDRPMRFFISEIIREKIFLNYQKEIPYSVEVVVESYKELPDKTHISATIFVARETQKRIIIGHKGESIKQVGMQARRDIEAFIEKHVYLELTVKVSKDWRDNDLQLRKFGYSI